MLLFRKAEAIKEDFKSFEEFGLHNFSLIKDFKEEFKAVIEKEDFSDFIKDLKKNLPLLKKYIPKDEERDKFEELIVQYENIVEDSKKLKIVEEKIKIFEKIGIFNSKSPLSVILNHCFENLTYEAIINFEINTLLNTLFTEFENYLFQVFKFLVLKNPELLNKKNVSLEELNLLGDLNKELINEIVAEKSLHDLFYYGYENAFNYANFFFKLKLIIPKKDILMLMIYKQIRNIYTHRDGTADLLFMKKIRRYGNTINFHKYDDVQSGEKIKITYNTIEDLFQLTADICKKIDNALLEQYPELKIPIRKRIENYLRKFRSNF